MSLARVPISDLRALAINQTFPADYRHVARQLANYRQQIQDEEDIEQIGLFEDDMRALLSNFSRRSNFSDAERQAMMKQFQL